MHIMHLIFKIKHFENFYFKILKKFSLKKKLFNSMFKKFSCF